MPETTKHDMLLPRPRLSSAFVQSEFEIQVLII